MGARIGARGAVVGVVALALALASGWWLHYRMTYKTFAWWSAPQKLYYCGRDYDPSGTVAALPKGDGRLTEVYRFGFGSWPVYKQTWTPQAAGPHCSPSGSGTAVVLYLVRGTHAVDQYNLSGGP
ncbi:hypothetical protein ABH931_005521 [Streptacidiphilus sp. MAP12-33]|uniref:hypothetical protein n=1 Tax=Streptacidiphilus sp. MAP12-33 TaxID=3156266 RepID=UPI003516FBAE